LGIEAGARRNDKHRFPGRDNSASDRETDACFATDEARSGMAGPPAAVQSGFFLDPRDGSQ
jgi:hypothetical protein